MRKRRQKPGSLKTGLVLSTLLCWILPIIIVTLTAGILLNNSYNQSLMQSVNADTEIAMGQTELRMNAVIEDSKAVSYDGVVRQAYMNSLTGEGSLYRQTTDYLSQKFARSEYFRAVFISFTGEPEGINAYVAAPGVSKTNLLRDYTERTLPEVKELLAEHDTGIFFLSDGTELYVVRNLLDNRFEPYAILVMELEKDNVFQSLYGISGIQSLELSIDGVEVPVALGTAEPLTGSDAEIRYETDVDGHSVIFSGRVMTMSIWDTVPLLRWAILIIVSLVIPLMLLIVRLFRRNLNHPMEVLIDANTRVQAGERGYNIREDAPNIEFMQLYGHFNSMSDELKSQFERLYQEQQSLQQSKIKALQSQINPHFLNNTLEIINWEARLADNEKVCSMIEALSVMLDAATNRDGRSKVPLAEELRYVDAYLYITKERLGDRLILTRDVDESLLDCAIPLLMLQPIIENAVEHDLSRSGGELCLRVFQQRSESGGTICFEIEHDGSVSADDWESIRHSIDNASAAGAEPLKGGSVGLRNVNNRLKLLYGDDYFFDISQRSPGRILARIELPLSARTILSAEKPI